MSTRTNIKLTHGETVVVLYRHHDGYPAETGADLVTRLRLAGQSVNAFLQGLLDARYDKASYEDEARRIYEITSAVHGDIDWAYAIEFDGQHMAIGAGEVKRGAVEDPYAFAMAVATHNQTSLERFVANVVNPAIAEQNARLEELKAKNPGSHWQDYGPTQLLQVEGA